jgi:hypothetical protein
MDELKAPIEKDLEERSQSQVDSRAISNLAECAACATAVKSVNDYNYADYGNYI